MENTGIEIPSLPDTSKDELHGCLTLLGMRRLTITSDQMQLHPGVPPGSDSKQRMMLHVRGKCVPTESPETLPVGRGQALAVPLVTLMLLLTRQRS